MHLQAAIEREREAYRERERETHERELAEAQQKAEKTRHEHYVLEQLREEIDAKNKELVALRAYKCEAERIFHQQRQESEKIFAQQRKKHEAQVEEFREQSRAQLAQIVHAHQEELERLLQDHDPKLHASIVAAMTHAGSAKTGCTKDAYTKDGMHRAPTPPRAPGCIERPPSVSSSRGDSTPPRPNAMGQLRACGGFHGNVDGVDASRDDALTWSHQSSDASWSERGRDGASRDTSAPPHASAASSNSTPWWQKWGFGQLSEGETKAVEENIEQCTGPGRGPSIRALQEAHDRELAQQRAEHAEQLAALRKEVKQLQNEKRQIWLRCRWQNAA